MKKIFLLSIFSTVLFAQELVEALMNNIYLWPTVVMFGFIGIILVKNKLEMQDHISRLERKQSELDKVQTDFVKSQKIAGIGLWTMNRQTDTISFSEGAYRILEIDSATFDGTFESFLKVVHPNDLYILQSAYNDSPIVDKKYIMEYRIVTPLGKTKYVEVRYEHIVDDNGVFTASKGFVFDITQQRKLEEELIDTNMSLEHKVRERTKELKSMLSLFDKGDSTLFRWNNDDTWSVDYVSESVSKIVGYEPEEFMSGRVVYALCIHPDDLTHVTAEVENAIEQNVDYFEHDPYRILCKNGETKWIHDRTVIMRDERNDITHFLGYITDITGIKERDKQLMMQSRMAQMGEMISMIAHQWRQPLAAISATTMNIKLHLDMQDCSAHSHSGETCKNELNNEIELVDNYVRNMTETIDDFRNFYKSDKKPQHLTLGKCAESALDIVRGSFKSDGIEIIEHFENEKEVSILKNEMMQVILNILKNAQDNFKEKQIPNPTLTLVSRTEEYAAILEIYDNGGGIKESLVDKIFDPYFTTKEERNGTGIGLYMSKTIVEQHHQGKLSAKNIDGGACFSIVIDLPLRLDLEDQREEELSLA